MRHSINVGLVALSELDLANVKRKIMEPEPEGKGWDHAQADEAERWYRHFLEICLRHPDLSVVPNYPIDMMWHQHILDTHAYSKDCSAIFGEMLHHYPYFGMMGDVQERDDSFTETNELYNKYFGEDCMSMTAFKRPRPETQPLPPPPICAAVYGSTPEKSATERFPNAFTVQTNLIGVNCKGGGGSKCGRSCGRGK